MLILTKKPYWKSNYSVFSKSAMRYILDSMCQEEEQSFFPKVVMLCIALISTLEKASF